MHVMCYEMQDATNLKTTYTHACELMYVCTMQGGMKKQWDEYYALYIVT